MGSWRRDAACQDAPWDWFFPEVGETTGRAKMLCAACPVREQCLAEAMADHSVQGVWGGLSGKARRAALSRATA